jgi:hypothetical protein
MSGRGSCLVVLVCCIGIAGCADSSEGGASTGSLLPQIPDRGGPVMAHPQLVPIFFADDPSADTTAQFSRWIVTSSWLALVGTEYGVGAGSVLGVAHRTEAAPDQIDDVGVVDLLFRGLGDGTLPKPVTGGLDEVLYMIHFPAHTTVTAGNAKSCVEFGAYHSSARRNGVELAYAVMPTCPSFVKGLDDRESHGLVTSHELIEAATDPFPVNHPGFHLRDPVDPWIALGGEVADLCERGDQSTVWREGGFVVQRSWSNLAAAAGRDPCVPGQIAQYFNLTSLALTVPRIAPGGQQAIGLRGWASGAPPGFAWSLMAKPAGDSDVTVTLGKDTMSATSSTRVDVAVPSTAARGATVRWYVYSISNAAYEVLPMFAYVDDPCSSFTSCDACARHGCGFCATTGRCEPPASAGSAVSSCPAAEFATWSGSCPGFCAAHGANCTECASQFGCGWCASGGGQCLEASHNYGQPEGASCAYADWSFTPAYCPM